MLITEYSSNAHRRIIAESTQNHHVTETELCLGGAPGVNRTEGVAISPPPPPPPPPLSLLLRSFLVLFRGKSDD